jgi:glycosyltransferase involved in cell wall biosynthesis
MANVYFKAQIPSAYMGIRETAVQLKGVDEYWVHDLFHLEKTSGLGFWDRYRENKWLKRSCSDYPVIHTYSEYTQNELTKQIPGISDKVAVVPPKADTAYVVTDDDARDVVRYQFTQGDAYFIYRGPIHPAAGLVNLLKGFSVFKKRIGSNMKMVLCGPQGDYSATFLADLENYKFRSDVVVTSEVSPYDQVALVSSAYALVHPCRWERFGIPVMNAMKAGVPVLTAANSAMAEFTGMAGMFFDVNDFEDIGRKLILIYNDEQMRADMIGTGLIEKLS